jgi:hypothetical protein
MNKPSDTYPVPNDKPADIIPAAEPVFSASGASPVQPSPATGKTMNPADGPRLVFRDGVAYVEGCNLPIWRLEMGRRGGSRPDPQIAVTPGLTPEGLEMAFAYAREHSAEFDPLIRYHSGAEVPPEDEGDDEDDATFEAELDAMFTEYAQVFRRLAE